MSKLSRYHLLISLVRSAHECPHKLNSQTASSHNNLLIRRGIEGLVFISEDVMTKLGLTEQARNTRLKNLVSALAVYDFSHVVNFFKSVYDILINHISLKESICDYSDFKDRLMSKCGFFDPFLLTVIKEPLVNVLNAQTSLSRGCFRNPSTNDMGLCSQYLQFLVKLNFTDVGLEDKGLSDYLACEAECTSFVYDAKHPILNALANTIGEMLKGWDYDGAMPHHGPGSVADTSYDKYKKYINLKYDAKVKYLYPMEDNSIKTLLPIEPRVPLKRTSKLVFVPKNITKLRSISMEPAILQYLQQGCKDSLMRFFQQSKLHKHIKLEDQNQNKSFAYHASITDDFSTIDLSHASDSVHWGLCKVLFRKVPSLLRWMMCTRSTHTLLPNGEEIALAKFAPMGSALCFPIETIMFAAAAKLSIALSKEEARDRDLATGIRQSNTFFSVYGDDIIVPVYAANKCIEILKFLGFTPNEEKSYISGPFKESCGGNFFCGYDITPLKFTASFDEGYLMGVSPEAYAALVSYANLAYTKGLPMFRLYCIKLIFEAELKPLFSADPFDTAAIFSDQPTNFHLKVKSKCSKNIHFNNYQKEVYVYDWVKPKYTSTPNPDERVFLFEWLRLSQYRDGDFLTNGCKVTRKEISPRKESYPIKNFIGQKRVTLLFDSIQPLSRQTFHEHKMLFARCESSTTMC